MNGKVSIFYMKTPLKEIHVLARDELFRNVRVGTVQRCGLSPLLCAGVNIRKVLKPESSLSPCAETNIL